MRVFIGFDIREPLASTVAAKSLRRITGGQLEPEFLDIDKLRSQGLITRPSDERGGRDYDLVSNSPASTRFAFSRFLVPIICQTRYALFVDADVVFLRDPREMLPDPYTWEPPVRVVKHVHTPTQVTKMAEQAQIPYARKNWSSVMLFDCQHQANFRLSLRDVNERPGLYLHQFGWLHDSEIGELDPAWNWLVNETPRPENVGIAHFTNGGPFVPGWPGAPNDDLWREALQYGTNHRSSTWPERSGSQEQ
jgi:hypothetical protein